MPETSNPTKGVCDLARGIANAHAVWIETPFGPMQIGFCGPDSVRINTGEGRPLVVFGVEYKGSLRLDLRDGEWGHGEIFFYRDDYRRRDTDMTQAADAKVRAALTPIAAEWARNHPGEQARAGIARADYQIERKRGELAEIDKQRAAKAEEIAEMEAERRKYQSFLRGSGTAKEAT